MNNGNLGIISILILMIIVPMVTAAANEKDSKAEVTGFGHGWECEHKSAGKWVNGECRMPNEK